ncbi:MAG TPA: hypothetical protein DEB74_07760 [Lachnospiraceae bacterium]|nr:hypothetical protein [Lachnospiraceae bacterium]
MNFENVMKLIQDEAISQTPFYMELNVFAESKDKLGFINKLVDKFNCDFDSASIVCNYFIDGTPLPSTLSPAEIAHNRQEAQDLLNKPKCPTCNSTNLKKISATSKVVNTAVFGLFGTKRFKQFHCNNCGYEW